MSLLSCQIVFALEASRLKVFMFPARSSQPTYPSAYICCGLQTGQEQLQESWVQAHSGQRGRSVEEGHRKDTAVPNRVKNSHNTKHESTTWKQA